MVEKNKIKNIYICGPTVYNHVHIGNLRPIVTFDIFKRSLIKLGQKVNLIHNITDIDDKIILQAQKEGLSEAQIALKYEKSYFHVLKLLNVLPPDLIPKVIESIQSIIDFINTLLKINIAYELEGNVFLSVKKIKSYGNISNRKLSDMQFKKTMLSKKYEADFVLWKTTTIGLKFSSPWGDGRPGWHTECASFIDQALNGESLDIHGGGIDLLFPHHENENAQYMAKNGKLIAKEWRHTGQVNINGDKMSKSTSNIFDAKDFIKKYDADTLRILFLSSSYSAPINLTNISLKLAQSNMYKFKKAFISALELTDMNLNRGSNLSKKIAQLIIKWDFAKVFKIINEIIKEFNKVQTIGVANDIIEIMKLLGFNFSLIKITEKDKLLISKWNNLREKKLFKQADIIREKLINKKII